MKGHWRCLAVPIVMILVIAGCATTPVASPSVAPSHAGASPAASVGPPASHDPATATPPPSTVRDGEAWLAYAWYAPSKSIKDIFLVRPNGSDGHLILGDVPGEHTSAVWSPNGHRLAFAVAGDEFPNGSIWLADADGSSPTLLTTGGGACPDGVAHPSWSPDGSQLAFICYPDPRGKEGSVATFDLESGQIRRLATVRWPEHLDGAPAWSPDGRSLAYAILHWDPTDTVIDGSLLAVVAAAGGKERRITTFASNLSDPDWSPDGTRLATYSYDLGNMHTTPHPSNLYLIQPDGSDQRPVTRGSVDGNRRIAGPRWTPDGAELVCVVGTSSHLDFTTDDLQLAFVDPAGGEPVLIDPVVHGSQPDLRAGR